MLGKGALSKSLKANGPKPASPTSSTAVVATMPAVDDADNPFRIPTDHDIFKLQEEEARRREELRESERNMKVWEKGSLSHTNKALADTVALLRERPAAPTSKPVFSSASSREKENMAEFIAKKRDMFLLQMSLNTKKEEIRKLEDKAQLKEEALTKSELMLQADALRFDAFLKENDKKAHDALKRADQETKLKQEKAAEIKKLNQEIAKVESEMSKYEQRLADCLKYKEFLDSVTPVEHLDRIKKQRALREQSTRDKEHQRDEERQARRERKLEMVKEQMQLQAAHQAAELAAANESGGGDSGPAGAGAGAVMEIPSDEEIMEKIIEEEDEQEALAETEAETVDLDVSEEMFFTEPFQLLDIFAQLEERNLFLIQNVQETEEALEELKQKYKDTESKMEEHTSGLRANIEELREKIDVENKKAEELITRSRSNASASDQNALLSQLATKVTDVYLRCGFDTADVDTLGMLREIESKLEDLMLRIGQMDPEVLAKGEKEKETERRNRVRVAKYQEQQRMYDERLAKSNARAKAPVHKREGKPVMFRSPPIRKKRVQKAQDTKKDQEAEDIRQFFT